MHALRSGTWSRRAAALAGLLALAGVIVTPFGTLAAPPTPVPTDSAQAALDAGRTGPGFVEHHQVVNNEQHSDVNVCSTAIDPGQARCFARVRTDTSARNARPARNAQAQPNAITLGNNGAYDPGYLLSAYNLSTLTQSGGRGQVVAIVDAYDSPTAQSDLAYYRSYFGLPALPTCSGPPASTACFRKVNQNGATGPLPAKNTGWAVEIALDLDMVSAICPNCSILLVEANSNSVADLAAAANTAATSLGANVVSNSYGAGEFNGETTFDTNFNHPGVAVTASSGDSGYGVEYPAASPYVTAVGGTSLQQATSSGSRDASESAWSGAGSGCSTYEPRPDWQASTSWCSSRTVADVSAVADPNTGVWTYDTTGGVGWGVIGGTSVAAPLVGSVYALAGNAVSSHVLMNSDPYGQPALLFDISDGSNGSCGGTYLCTAGPAYDGPTGLGTPNGDGAFANGSGVVQPGDFSLALQNNAVTVKRGGNVNDTVTLSALNGYHSSVNFTVSGVPANVTATFSASPLTPTATSRLSVRTSNRTASGSYTLTITATGSDGTVHTQTLRLTVQ
jgi:subtilase family serine protease